MLIGPGHQFRFVFHIAEHHAGLLPDNANARARAITWMFAALNTLEPPILDLQTTRLLEGDKLWYEQRLPVVEDRIRDQLGKLSDRLGNADWLDGAFSAGALMMAAVLLRLKASGMLDEYLNLPPMSPGPPTSVLSTLNWRFSLASHRPADEGQLWAQRRHCASPRPARMRPLTSRSKTTPEDHPSDDSQ